MHTHALIPMDSILYTHIIETSFLKRCLYGLSFSYFVFCKISSFGAPKLTSYHDHTDFLYTSHEVVQLLWSFTSLHSTYFRRVYLCSASMHTLVSEFTSMFFQFRYLLIMETSSPTSDIENLWFLSRKVTHNLNWFYISFL